VTSPLFFDTLNTFIAFINANRAEMIDHLMDYSIEIKYIIEVPIKPLVILFNAQHLCDCAVFYSIVQWHSQP